ncbi:hypothetical protein I302_105602 [Kwoniella bestiolae CBS 10118]|uniref:Hydrophobin n=1 Tax=Kwoniella bestiolae CBS 10118 TaxID=1296100 RepID=A0A1B9G1L9_9TREE|nr:hypothetical protein I302_04721 [Kwoniella bestiolae CBS 10118]OCF24911.1 hypothetical protein I302_04721 [Kwoniella bestiolae CBS 10118]
MFALKNLMAVGALFALAGVDASPVRRAQCSADNQNYVDNVVCPTLNNLDSFLNFQADNVGANVVNVLGEVNKLLVSDDPVSTIVKDVTGGVVTGVTDGVTFTLKDFAATVQQLDPDCKCNLVACNNDLNDARTQCQLSSTNPMIPQGCGDAISACAAFYSRDQINSYTGCCSSYQLTNNQ